MEGVEGKEGRALAPGGRVAKTVLAGGEVSTFAGAWGLEAVELWAEEGVYHEQQANWLETFCKRWKKVVEGVRCTERKREILKKSAGHAHREDAILE